VIFLPYPTIRGGEEKLEKIVKNLKIVSVEIEKQKMKKERMKMNEKKVRIIFIVLLFLSLMVFAQSSNIPKGKIQTQENDRLDGDSPLSPLISWSGTGEVKIFTSPLDGINNPSDDITISNILAGATIIQAYFAVTSWESSEMEASAVFNGVDLPQIPATVSDPDGEYYYLSYYRWDVTDYLDGNGVYHYSTSNINYCYLSYLIVIIEDPSLPYATMMINDGSESLQNAVSTTFFQSSMATGAGNLLILTQASDVDDGPTEYISFNETTILGPGDIFNSNLGDHADLMILSDINILEGENSLSIYTGDDWFGIHCAVLSTGEINTEVGESEIAGTSIYDLKQNYPNPFNPTTTINFSIQSNTKVELTIYNIKGQKIKTLVNSNFEKGNHSIIWKGINDSGNSVSSGVYFYKLAVNGKTKAVKKCLMLK